MASRMSAEDVFLLISRVFSLLDILADGSGVWKIETIGDCYHAAAGLDPNDMDPAGATVALVSMALEMQTAVCQLDGDRIRFRVGLHRGSVIAGVR